MEVKWFASVRRYLQHIGGSIELDDTGMASPLQRIHAEKQLKSINSAAASTLRRGARPGHPCSWEMKLRAIVENSEHDGAYFAEVVLEQASCLSSISMTFYYLI
jgi:hypothetical protein